MTKKLFEGIKSLYGLRFKLALRTAIACLIAMLIEHYLNLPEGYWLVFTTFLVTQMTVSMTFLKGIMRIAGTVAGCVVAFLCLYLFSGHPYIITAICTGWAAVTLYIGMSGFYPYAMMLAAFTPFMVSILGHGIFQAAIPHVLYRMGYIIFGVIISWFMVILVWPVDEEREFYDFLKKLIARALDISFRFPDIKDLQDTDKKIRTFRRLSIKADRFLSNSGSEFRQAHGEFYSSLVRLCEVLIANTFRIVNLSKEASTPENEISLSKARDFSRYISDRLEEISFTEMKPEKRSGLKLIRTSPFRENLQKLRTYNRNAAAGAAKSAMSVFAATVLFSIPFGHFQASIYSILVAFAGHQSSALRRFIYILSGTLVGCLAGIVYTLVFGVPGLTDIIYILIMLLIFSYINLGQEEWSYAGTFAGFSIILCAGSPDSLNAVINIAEIRFKGILFGGLTAALIFKYISPVDYRKLLAEAWENLMCCLEDGHKWIQKEESSDKTFPENPDIVLNRLRQAKNSYLGLLIDYKWDMYLSKNKMVNFPQEAEVLKIYRDMLVTIYSIKLSFLPNEKNKY